MVLLCWASVADGGPAIKQHFFEMTNKFKTHFPAEKDDAVPTFVKTTLIQPLVSAGLYYIMYVLLNTVS